MTSIAVVGPVEGPACPGCGLVPLWRIDSVVLYDHPYVEVWDGHQPWCPTIDTCGQIGPPWLPREQWHPEADWLTGKWTAEAHRAHMARAHPPGRVEVYPFAVNHGRTLYAPADALEATLWPPKGVT